jgi:cytochrome c oxidase subunit 3
MAQASGYYVPHGSYWPFFLTVGLFVLVIGAANLLNGAEAGTTWMMVGGALVIAMVFGWFGSVIHESVTGQYNDRVDKTFRLGMGWFIFSEVMFFAAFFGALFYGRILSNEWLGGMGSGMLTHQFLWPEYDAVWPTNGPADMGGDFEPMGAWGLPAINTLILLSSGATVTWAHWGLKNENRRQLILGLLATVVLGFVFVYLQATEYMHAYHELNLTLGSGMYGSTFFLLTGFHGMHVTLGAIILTVILIRSIIGHFSPKNHFAFEAAAWYWHFVDVVWLGLFVFVYWL